jgi:hypothetical protein
MRNVRLSRLPGFPGFPPGFPRLPPTEKAAHPARLESFRIEVTAPGWYLYWYFTIGMS